MIDINEEIMGWKVGTIVTPKENLLIKGDTYCPKCKLLGVGFGEPDGKNKEN